MQNTQISQPQKTIIRVFLLALMSVSIASINALSAEPDSGHKTSKNESPSALEAYRSAPEPEKMVRKVADYVLETHSDPTKMDFNWGQGTLMVGMMHAYHLTQDERYLKFIRKFANHHAKAGIRHHFSGDGYCGNWGPGYPVLMLYEITDNQNHLEISREIVEFIMTGAARTKAGGLGHKSTGDLQHQLWVDTLYMACPVLSKFSALTDQPKYQKEAVRQLELFSEHLQNPDTGMYYHIWDERNREHSSEYWGRGNGWVAMSFTEVLKNEKKGTKDYQKLVDAFTQQLSGIVSHQDSESGLWYTVLDEPDTYLETSASAMILYSMLESRQEQLVDVPYTDSLRKGWMGLSQTIEPNGRVGGISTGTGPNDESGYESKERGTYTWGTGAFLMAASAYAESDLGEE